MHTRASSLMLIFFMACCRLGPEGKKDDALTTPKVKKSKSHDPVEEGSHTKHKKQAPQAEQTPREPQTHTRLTAAKAKVTKPEPVVACVKNECVTPETARAVAECLRRKSTEELGKSNTPKVSTADPASSAPPVPPVNHMQHPGDEDTSSDEDPEEHERQREELERREEQLKLKREAHARYMRFSRSLTSFLASARFVVG